MVHSLPPERFGNLAFAFDLYGICLFWQFHVRRKANIVQRRRQYPALHRQNPTRFSDSFFEAAGNIGQGSDKKISKRVPIQPGASGKTVFVSSHLLHEVERTCTHVAILRKGQLVRQSSVRELLAGATAFQLRADDLERLRVATLAYPRTTSATLEDDTLIAQFTDNDAAAFNRYLAGHEIFLSHLAPHALSLEEAFIGLTRDEATTDHSGVA